MSDVDFLLKTLDLKDEGRTGWEVRGIDNPESVASHSWGVAFLSFLLAEEAGIERQKAVEMALLHDIHEAESGDIMSSGLSPEEERRKGEREREGFDKLLSLMEKEDDRLREVWEEYERGEGETSKFVKDMDLLDAALQAYHYRLKGRYGDEEGFFRKWNGMEEFFEGVREELRFEVSRKMFDSIHDRYREEIDGI